MKTRTKLLLIGAATILAGLAVLGFTFHFTDDNSPTNPEFQVSRQTEPRTPDHLESPADNQRVTNSGTSDLDSSRSEQPLSTATTYDPRGDSNNAVSSGTSKSRTQAGATIFAAETEVDWPHIPLAFLNYGGILPATPEVAAAIQHIQDEFVNATGAGTANPADPTFGQTWELAQPTADEEFYALFGSEAFNALSIAEARQRGHF